MNATTHRTIRQDRLDRAALETLAPHDDQLLDEDLLRGEIPRQFPLRPAPSGAEIGESIRHLDRMHRIIGVAGETGMKWRLSALGLSWLMEHT